MINVRETHAWLVKFFSTRTPSKEVEAAIDLMAAWVGPAEVELGELAVLVYAEADRRRDVLEVGP